MAFPPEGRRALDALERKERAAGEVGRILPRRACGVKQEAHKM